MKPSRIVVVEDEEDIREILEYALGREGFAVDCAADGSTALAHILRDPPDLVLLDLMLPDKDGLEVCRALKEERATSRVPIIMVTAKGDESDIVLGLGLGADDYVLKPFGQKELVARVKAVLRRAQTAAQPVDDDVAVVRGELRVDRRRHKAWCGERELGLTATEFEILHLLASHPGRVFTRGQILAVARGSDAAAFERSVDAHVRSLRMKLGDRRGVVETVRSIGYRFTESAE